MTSIEQTEMGLVMNLAILACIVGTIIPARLPVLLDSGVLVWGLPVVLLGVCYTWPRMLAAFYLGLYFGLVNLDGSLASRLPAALAGEPLEVWGTVVSLPENRDGLVRFRFQVDRCQSCHEPLIVSLSWYSDEQIQSGERWRLVVRLNRPRGSVNPGLFDYQAWLLAQGIDANGYVLEGERLVGSLAAPHHQLRGWLRTRLQAVMPPSQLSGLLLALSLGESAQILPSQWRVLSATGTNHLLIISGLHVGLVAALCLSLFSWLLRRLRYARAWALGLSLIVVMGYGGIAGLGLPVQRALVMLVCASLLLILRRHVSLLSLWCYALLLVTLINPLASLTIGFWLSFGAVFVLIYGFAGRTPMPGSVGVIGSLWAWLRSLLRSQWLVFFGMSPLLLYFVGQLASLAFIANLVAIPLVSLVIVPLLLLSLITASVNLDLTALILRVAEAVLHYLWLYLEAVASLEWVYYAGDLPLGLLLLGFVGALVVLQPAGFLPRWPGLLMMLPMIINTMPRALAPGEAEITVLDVGQGLSVLVRSNDGSLLYDAGPRFSDRFDAGQQIVTPYLRRSGIGALEVMIISHNDQDHAGGAAAVMANFPVARSYYGEPPRQGAARSAAGARSADCGEARQWHQGGVRFSLLGVGGSTPLSANNQSCLLLVEAAGFSVLLPGDIESETEFALLDLMADQVLPRVDVLIAPHHGSLTSSHPAFLNRLKPSAVVVSAGYQNRFDHPHAQVLARYRARSMQVFNTANDGAIIIRLGKTLQIQRARNAVPRIWYN